MSDPTQYVLDPWSDAIRFIAVPTEHWAVRIPKPMRFDYRSMFVWGLGPQYATCHRKPYASEWLRWSGCVYVAEKDEARLLAALQAVEMALLLFSLLGPQPEQSAGCALAKPLSFR